MLAKPVSDYLATHRREHLEKLLELLRFPSIANVSDDPDPCELAADWLARHLETLGFEARVVPTPGKPNVLASAHVRDDAPTLLFYGHYDVQPPDPLDQWQSPPFEPAVRDECVYARGANDDKGQLLTHLMAVEAWQRAGGGLPVNVKFFLEGEEEIGSPNVEAFIADHARDLAADAIVISDSEFFAEDTPSITYALRGVTYLGLTLKGPSHDLHSGLNGGAVANPINALARMVADMHDADGRVTIPGFYDDVLELTDAERDQWNKLPFDEDAYAASCGVRVLGGGEKGFTTLERRWSRPTLDCNGIFGGYTGQGAKTIIPAAASVKITMRLVPNQDPQKILAACRKFVAEHTPPGVTAEVYVHGNARPVMLSTDSPAVNAAREALKEAFGREAAMIRCGASVPITEVFQRLLRIDPVLMGFGLPDDKIHSPNERFRLTQLWRGSQAAAAFMQNLAGTAGTGGETKPLTSPARGG